MAWYLAGTKPLSEPMLAYCQFDLKEHIISIKFCLKFNAFHIQENAFENVLCKMASILFQPQYVKDWFTGTGAKIWEKYLCLTTTKHHKASMDACPPLGESE